VVFNSDEEDETMPPHDRVLVQYGKGEAVTPSALLCYVCESEDDSHTCTILLDGSATGFSVPSEPSQINIIAAHGSSANGYSMEYHGNDNRVISAVTLVDSEAADTFDFTTCDPSSGRTTRGPNGQDTTSRPPRLDARKSGSDDDLTDVEIALVAVGVFLLLVLICACLCCLILHNRNKSKSNDEEGAGHSAPKPKRTHGSSVEGAPNDNEHYRETHGLLDGSKGKAGHSVVTVDDTEA